MGSQATWKGRGARIWQGSMSHGRLLQKKRLHIHSMQLYACTYLVGTKWKPTKTEPTLLQFGQAGVWYPKISLWKHRAESPTKTTSQPRQIIQNWLDTKNIKKSWEHPRGLGTFWYRKHACYRRYALPFRSGIFKEDLITMKARVMFQFANCSTTSGSIWGFAGAVGCESAGSYTH